MKNRRERADFVRWHQVLFWIHGYPSEDKQKTVGDFDLNLKRRDDGPETRIWRS